MKLKNINIIEQHIEKIVLALAALFCLYVLVFYVFGHPYAVEFRGRKVSPGRAEEEKQKRLKTLELSLQSSDSLLAKELGARKVDGYAEEYKKRLVRAPLAGGKLGISFNVSGLSDSDVTVPEQGAVEYLVEVPSLPVDVTVRASPAVLLSHDEIMALLIQRLGVQEAEIAESIAANYDQLVDDEVPRDFEPVTIMGKFDMNTWIQQLEETPEPQRIPKTWWQTRLLLADVVLERQKLDSETGHWPDDGVFKVISPLPGSVKEKLRPLMVEQQKWDIDWAGDVIDFISRNADGIEKPSLEMITQDRIWLPPDAEVEHLSPDQEQELYELRNRIRNLQERLERLKGRKLKKELTGFGPRDFSDRPAELMVVQTLKPKRNSGLSKPKNVSPARSEERREAIQNLELELQEKQLRMDELLGTTGRSKQMMGRPGLGPEYRAAMRRDFGALDRMMDTPGLRPGMGGLRSPLVGPASGMGVPIRRKARTPGGMPARLGFTQPGETEPHVFEIWAHDLSAKPGTSYRYRLRVRVLNPLFQKGNRLGDQQHQKYSNLLALDSEPSEWSDPVKIEARMQFFVVSGSGRRADIEMYRMFGGHRHLETFRAGPGDPIGTEVILDYQEEARAVNMSTQNVVIDIQRRNNIGGATSSTVLIYYDQLVGQLNERVVQIDRIDPDRIKLNNEHAQAQALARRPRG